MVPPVHCALLIGPVQPLSGSQSLSLFNAAPRGHACMPACPRGRSLALVLSDSETRLRRLEGVGAGFLGGSGASRPPPPPALGSQGPSTTPANEGQAGWGMSSPCPTPGHPANLGKGLTLSQPQFPHCLPTALPLWGLEVRIWAELEGKLRPERVGPADGFGTGGRIHGEWAPVSTSPSCKAGIRVGDSLSAPLCSPSFFWVGRVAL